MSLAKRLYAIARLGATKPDGLSLAFYAGRGPTGSPGPDDRLTAYDVADRAATRQSAPAAGPPYGRGPLPVAKLGRPAYATHAGCGGAGCAECSGTGYAEMAPEAIRALEVRLAMFGPGASAPPAPPAPPPKRAAKPKTSDQQLTLF